MVPGLPCLAVPAVCPLQRRTSACALGLASPAPRDTKLARPARATVRQGRPGEHDRELSGNFLAGKIDRVFSGKIATQ